LKPDGKVLGEISVARHRAPRLGFLAQLAWTVEKRIEIVSINSLFDSQNIPKLEALPTAAVLSFRSRMEKFRLATGTFKVWMCSV